MQIFVEDLDKVVIDGVNAGDIASVIVNYPPEQLGAILAALREWRNLYEGQADKQALSTAQSEFDRQIEGLTQQLAEANQQVEQKDATIAQLQAQLDSVSQQVVSQEEILRRLEALEQK